MIRASSLDSTFNSAHCLDFCTERPQTLQLFLHTSLGCSVLSPSFTPPSSKLFTLQYRDLDQDQDQDQVHSNQDQDQDHLQHPDSTCRKLLSLLATNLPRSHYLSYTRYIEYYIGSSYNKTIHTVPSYCANQGTTRAKLNWGDPRQRLRLTLHCAAACLSAHCILDCSTVAVPFTRSHSAGTLLRSTPGQQ